MRRQAEKARSKLMRRADEVVPQNDRNDARHVMKQCRDAAKGRDNATTDLLRLFRPCVSCGAYNRVGSANDGGYVMCPDLLKNVRAAYSFGINGVDDWGASISSTLGVPVFQFDCWNKQRPACTEDNCDLTFREECLSQFKDYRTDQRVHSVPSKAGKVSRSLEEHLERNPPPPTLNTNVVGGDLLLKMDVESSEWNAITHTGLHTLKRMRQILVEFHVLSDVACHAFYGDVIKHILDAGFAVAHIHGNNWGPMDVFDDGKYMLPDAVEVTFVNREALPAQLLQQSACASEQEILLEDARNRWSSPELPPSQLPVDGSEADTATTEGVVQCRYFCSYVQAAVKHGVRLWQLQFVAASCVVVFAAGLVWAGRSSLKKLKDKVLPPSVQS